MAGADSHQRGEDTGRPERAVFISTRTILLVGLAVALAWALSSIGHILLLILASIFNIAVLLPVVDAMERRLPLSRGICATVLVLGIVVVLGATLVIQLQPIIDSVRSFNHNLPRLVGDARHTQLGSFLNGGSNSIETLKAHAGDISSGVAKISGGFLDVGTSAFGAVTVVFSVTFLTMFGLIDGPQARDAIGSLFYRDRREHYERITDRIIHATSRYMLGNLAISVICATVYGITAVILGLPYALALALVAGILDVIPNIGAILAGIIVGIVAITVSLGALIAFVIVIIVYQQIENYVLQPMIIGRVTQVSGFTVIVSVLVFGSLFGIIGAIIAVPIAASIQIVLDDAIAARRARVAAADAAHGQPA
jgi:predicted PurR-regulated permease PerM